MLKVKDCSNRIIWKTYKDAKEKIEQFGKCAIVRPTGFGKTFILAHIASEYKRVLYLYPRAVIKMMVQNDYAEILRNRTEFLTYLSAGKMGKTQVGSGETEYGEITKLLEQDWDLIVIDELHCAGANLAKKAMKTILKYTEEHQIPLLGASATPDRSDGYDVIHEVFGDVTTFEYGLGDAIRDGIMPKIRYVFSLYDEKEALEKLKKRIDGMKNGTAKNSAKIELTALEIELSRVENMPGIIRNTVTDVIGGDNYMKFVVFFSQVETLERQKSQVSRWFKTAFPNMKLRTLTIISRGEEAKNVENLHLLNRTDGFIDLIFCIDMLNYGYHVDDITGVVLMRGTRSAIIYNQQVGRCLSVKAVNSPIIFDLVNNFNQEYYYAQSMSEQNKNNVNTNAKHKRVPRTHGIGVKELVAEDHIAESQRLIEKIDRIINDEQKFHILDLWDDRQMPLKQLQKVTGFSHRSLKRILFEAGRIDENGKEIKTA